VPSSERLLIGVYLNGHVGTARGGFGMIHGGFGYDEQNQEGEKNLELCYHL
jgi:hypothetical protein